MFGDLIKDKFEGIDIGTRDIATELEIAILKGVEFGKEHSDSLPEEVQSVVKQYFDDEMDILVQMYLDEFTAVELIEILDTLQDELYERKLKFQLKLQDKILGDLLPQMLDAAMEDGEDGFPEEMKTKEGVGFLQALEDLSLDCKDDGTETNIWTTED